MSQDSADKTQAPTRQRLRKARKEGQIVRSRELTSCGMLLLSSVVLTCWAPSIAQFLMGLMRQQLRFTNTSLSHITRSLPQVVGETLITMLGTIITPLGILALFLIIAGMLPGGMIFSLSKLLPKGGNLNPLAGLGKILSPQNRMELLKAIAKCLLIAMTFFIFLQQHWQSFIQLSQLPLAAACSQMLSLLSLALLIMGSVLAVIVFIDVPYQQWQFIERLKMSKQEVKDERRSSEGRPEVKMRIRKIQIMMARSRLAKRVPKANVILLNPTHYAVAICYDLKKAQAPYVIAKGQDDMAQRIRELAVEHKKMMLTLPELTRAVYYSTQIDQEIPAGLYTAVAYVLGHVMQLQAYREGRGKEPQPLPQLTIPPAFKHTE
nr:flagellar type III secretion system protein FlhB [uncultured Tolumonas sp.]